jgi:hypothetical protein
VSKPRPREITSPGQIVKVQTLSDGGLRYTFDVQEDQVLEAAFLMECKRRGIPGRLTYVPDWSVLEEDPKNEQFASIGRRAAKVRE